MRKLLALALTGLALFAPGEVAAHPHIFVTARSELVFDPDGRIASVRNIFQFDEDYSAAVATAVDANGDGALTTGELAAMAETSVQSLAQYGFFTRLERGDGAVADFAPPSEYWFDVFGSSLVLYFTLPLAEPAPADGAVLAVYDPEFYVGFQYDMTDPIRLDGAPATCTATYLPPQEPDEATLAELARIPMDGTVPPQLVATIAALADRFRVACG